MFVETGCSFLHAMVDTLREAVLNIDDEITR